MNIRRLVICFSFLGLVSLTIFIASCGGGGGTSNNTTGSSVPPSVSLGDTLSPADDEVAAQTPSATPVPFSQDTLGDGATVQSIIDRDGLTAPTTPSAPAINESKVRAATQTKSPEQYKQDCVANMFLMAQTIINYRTFPDAPQQPKLAYSFGQKDPTVYAKPPSGCCPNRVYGLDCSGLLYLCANYAGLGIVKGQAVDQSNPKNWKINSSWGLTMKDVTQSVLSSGAYQDGDIVFWSRGHIGFICGGGGTVIQSNGGDGCAGGCSSPSSSCTVSSVCSENNNTVSGKVKGPRQVALGKMVLPLSVGGWGFGNPSVVLRLDTGDNLNGTWSGPETLPASADCPSSVSGTSWFTFLDNNGAAGGPITAEFTSTLPGGPYPYVFQGTRTNNTYTLYDGNDNLAYSGTLNVDPTSKSLDTITVSSPYFCGSIQEPNISFPLNRNESGNTPKARGRKIEAGCPSCLSLSRP